MSFDVHTPSKTKSSPPFDLPPLPSHNATLGSFISSWVEGWGPYRRECVGGGFGFWLSDVCIWRHDVACTAAGTGLRPCTGIRTTKDMRSTTVSPWPVYTLLSNVLKFYRRHSFTFRLNFSFSYSPYSPHLFTFIPPLRPQIQITHHTTRSPSSPVYMQNSKSRLQSLHFIWDWILWLGFARWYESSYVVYGLCGVVYTYVRETGGGGVVVEAGLESMCGWEVWWGGDAEGHVINGNRIRDEWSSVCIHRDGEFENKRGRKRM
jgi:hypothetical protein